MGGFTQRMTIRMIAYVATLLGMMYLLTQADKETSAQKKLNVAEEPVCTMELYRQKVQDVERAMRSLQSGDINIYQQAVAKMQDVSKALAENPNNLAVACQSVDEVLSILPH